MAESTRTKKSFHLRLLRWYRDNSRNLPWRQTKNPYYIWISEVMLQQTTVQAVIPYFNNWIKIFPDIITLAESPLQKVLKTWQGLGYYQRAKNLHSSSKQIMKDFKGQIPQDYDKLIKLPGFGPYTTAAVLSLAFDLPYPVVDANVRRVLMRLTGLAKEASPRFDKTLLEFLTPLLPKRNMGTFNQAMMELGSLVCRSKNPACLLCPLPAECRAYKNGKQEIIPKPKKRNYKKIEAVIGIIKKGDRYLIQKRPSSGLLADLWEFPGGKINPGENSKQALHREINEELDREVQSEKFLVSVRHAYTQFQVTLHAFECTLKQYPRLDKKNHRWVSLRSMRHYPLPSGSAKIVHFLEETHKHWDT
ncbi:MAG: A/G-specific adenine glycosylase [Candidatus Aminicenantes bacterium]|jgi:A/G-specific adenine glycosylase